MRVNVNHRNNGGTGNNYAFYKDTNSHGISLLESAFCAHDPRAYGAQANVLVNDHTAIQDAVSAGGLYLHPTLVYASVSLDITAAPADFRVYGGGTLLLLSGGGPLIYVGANPISFCDVTIDGNSATGAEPIILLTNNTAARFSNVRIRNGQGYAIQLVNSTVSLSVCNLLGNTSTGISMDGASNAYSVGCFGLPTNIGGT